MSQRNVETLIGRLVTDDVFRAIFILDPVAALTQFTESGYELTPMEIRAIKATDSRLWTRTAEQIDARLQKVSLGFL